MPKPRSRQKSKSTSQRVISVIIMGAAGRDFHNFNVFFRDNPNYKVVAFTATQIPDISGRRYPPELAGKLYPKGIPIYDEKDLPKLIKKYKVDICVLAYSDLLYDYVMHRASIVNASGADFMLMGTGSTMVKSKKPVIAVTAVRTGCGKSQTSRKIVEILKKKGVRAVAIRHPMPYGDLSKMVVQRFASYKDMDKADCTIEEREEYEPYIDNDLVVYAGVDYEKILKSAEAEADLILWDGGNNDFSFYKADLYITVVDPLRPGHEVSYYPGEVNVRLADIVIINKENSATREQIKTVEENVRRVNPKAKIIHANSKLILDGNTRLKGKRVIVVEDGPTTTHGGMGFGAGYVAAKRAGCRIVDPRQYAVGSIKKTFEKYNHLKEVLPAMGYSKNQIKELERTINKADCDLVISGTPIDLRRVLKVNKQIVRVRYDLEEKGHPNLEDILTIFLKKFNVRKRKIK
ncbi:MAG: cyclic 2,3-diphosphoglycerate synthase [Caldisphaeraceae archaeon]|nr:cyclic 2,3-diphosphoglycerate synthase [Caldisphaeraceae archaeon]